MTLTPDELRTLVRDAVRAELGERETPRASSPLVSKQVLAAQLGISVAGVDRLVRDGRIPFVRVGEVRRFDVAAVRAALASSEADAPKTAPNDSPVRLLSRGAR